MTIESSSLLGKALGTCTLECLLSRGGMGTVYLARQLRPHRMVAVKVLLPSSMFQKQAQVDFLARFRREADAIAALDHVHIMPLYEYGELDQLAYLVMPYITGGTLQQRLCARGALPLNEVLPILEQAAKALDYAHERGIIHRDIKPSNMIFHADGRLLLTDFGLAKMLSKTGDGYLPQVVQALSCGEQAMEVEEMDEDADATCGAFRPSPLSSSEAVIGTPEYLAPERALGQPGDGRADVYSLGVVLFQMLTGQVPFIGSSAISTALMHTEDEPPLPSTLLPSLTPGIEEVMLRALAKDPAQRYDTAGDFARALCMATRRTEAALAMSMPPHPPPDALYHAISPAVTLNAAKHSTGEATRLKPHSSQALNIFHVLLIVCCSLIVLGSIFVSLARGTLLPYSIAVHTSQTPTPQRTARATAQPTNQPTASQTAQLTDQSADSSTSNSLVPLVSVGERLYVSTSLDSACPGVQGAWSQDVNARVTCRGTGTELTNSLSATFHYLAGMFLNGLADGSGVPDDYVLQVEVIQEVGSQGDFGVLFRNQPDQVGHRHNGTYAFLINPNHGTWQAVVYDDVSGLPTSFANGRAALSANVSVIIDIIVRENTFTFYLNGVLLDQVTGPSHPNYSSGTLGFAVSTNTAALFNNLAVYVLP